MYEKKISMGRSVEGGTETRCGREPRYSLNVKLKTTSDKKKQPAKE